jgi:anti-sigma factor RsiW
MPHPEEVLQDYVDGRLTGSAADEVRAHLAECAACRAVRDELVGATAAARTLRVDVPMPADLLASVTRQLDAEASRLAAPPPTPPSAVTEGEARPGVGRRAFWWTAAALVAYLARPSRPLTIDLPSQVARDLSAVGSLSLPFAVRSRNAAEIERYFRESTGPRVRVIDLAMMKIELEGGLRHTLVDRASALYSYSTPSGMRLVCQMYEGRLDDLPEPRETREHNGFQFRVYERDGVTLVFWQEGELVCVLASKLPAADVIELAFVKAMQPS